MSVIEFEAFAAATTRMPTAVVIAGTTSTLTGAVTTRKPTTVAFVYPGVKGPAVVTTQRPSAAGSITIGTSFPGDLNDCIYRMKAVLPSSWFPALAAVGSTTTTPILDGVAAGGAYTLSWLYSLIGYVSAQDRRSTATGPFLDILGYDFLQGNVLRRPGEIDTAWATRIGWEINDPKVTRHAIIKRLTDLTGRAPRILEPPRAPDAGSYATISSSTSGLAFYGGAAPGWYGSLSRPYQVFVTAYRPLTAMGIPAGTVPDADIYATVAAAIPAATIGWVAISN